MNIIDGKAKADELCEQLKIDLEEIKRTGIAPCIAVILVGEDPASQVYVRNKITRCKKLGIISKELALPAETKELDLLTEIDRLNEDPTVHGILVQLPLPDHIEEFKVISRISPAKDVDGFHAENVGLLSIGKDGLVSCTPQAVSLLLDDISDNFSGSHAVVVGRSNIVGKPVVNLLLQKNCTVTIAHSHTKNLTEVCRTADILIAAVGRPHLIKGDWIKPGAIVIDVGINRVDAEQGSYLCGDVDFDQAKDIAEAITPVPGGVGPMTIACLMANTVKAAKTQSN